MKKIILVGLLLLLVSCKLINKAAINYSTNHFKISTYSNGAKEIVYLPMIHVGKPEFFNKVKRHVDSLRMLNYTVFYESITAEKNLDSVYKTELKKKMRKVIGFFPDYSNAKNFKSINIKGFIQQGHQNTGIDVTTDVHADLPLNKLISLYEKERGIITLSEYDLKTPLNEKYRNKVNKENFNFIIDSLRNDYLYKMVSESKSQKIAIVYGKGHMYTLFNKLKKKDSTWRYIPFWEVKNRQLKAIAK